VTPQRPKLSLKESQDKVSFGQNGSPSVGLPAPSYVANAASVVEPRTFNSFMLKDLQQRQQAAVATAAVGTMAAGMTQLQLQEEIYSQTPKKEDKGFNKGFIFSMIHSTIALTMAPLFLLSTLLGGRGAALLQAEHAAKSGLGTVRERFLYGVQHPMRWFRNVLRNATEATYVEHFPKTRVFGDLRERNRRRAQKLVRLVLRRDLTQEEVKKMYKWSKILLTCAVFPKAMNGIGYGLSSQQPSMIFEHMFELLTFPFALAQTPFIQNLLFMVSGFFSLGLANDLDNDKKRAKGDPNLRVYDMERLKSVFKPSSGLGLGERAKTLAQETAGMAKFTAEDIVVASKRLKRDFGNMAKGQANEITSGEGSAGKASLNFALLQIGTIPKLMLSFMQNEHSPIYQMIKAYSGFMQGAAAIVGDWSIFLLGKDGKTIGERLPVVGVTAEATGRITSYGKGEKPLATFLQKIGEAGNTLFYAVRSSKLQQD
jgi:hypothetical protein